ncbi:MAG TPA: hypothetical protein VGM52_12695 [Herbaspirillum sp.]
MLKILFWLLVAINGALFALGQGLLGKHVVQRSEPQRLAQQLNPEQLVLTPPAAAPAKPAPIVAAAVSPPVAPPASGASTATPMTAAAAAPSPAPAATPPAVKATRASVAIPASTPAPTPTPTPTSASASPSASTPPLLACVEIGNFDPGEAKSFRARLAAAKLSTRPAQRNVQEVASYMVFIAAEDGREGAGRRAAELRRLGLNDFYIMPDSSPMRDAISLGIFKTEAAAKAYIGQLIPKGIRSARISERTASTNKVAFRLRDLNTADQAGFATLASAFPNQTRRDCRD